MPSHSYTSLSASMPCERLSQPVVVSDLLLTKGQSTIQSSSLPGTTKGYHARLSASRHRRSPPGRWCPRPRMPQAGSVSETSRPTSLGTRPRCAFASLACRACPALRPRTCIFQAELSISSLHRRPSHLPTCQSTWKRRLRRVHPQRKRMRRTTRLRLLHHTAYLNRCQQLTQWHP